MPESIEGPQKHRRLRDGFQFFGGVRFGDTLNLDDAWELQFHHVALATGAGKPTSE